MIGLRRFANDAIAFILLSFTAFAAEDQSAIVPAETQSELNPTIEHREHESTIFAAEAQSKLNPTVEHRELESAFNLRIYWQQGYLWQGSSKERKWCMKCRSSNCSDGTGIKVARCDRDDPRQQFYFDNRRIRSRKNTDMCLKRYGRYIAMDGCDSNDSDQRWSNLSTGAPFELQIPGNDSKCASQHHHPKDGEVLYMNSCTLARRSTTDKWVVY